MTTLPYTREQMEISIRRNMRNEMDIREADIKWVPVTTMLQETVDSIDFGDICSCNKNDCIYFHWTDLIATVASDFGFWETVESIVTYGWTHAICNIDGTQHNGHHRLTAAILLCLDEVPVFEDDYYPSRFPDGTDFYHQDSRTPGIPREWFGEDVKYVEA